MEKLIIPRAMIRFADLLGEMQDRKSYLESSNKKVGLIYGRLNCNPYGDFSIITDTRFDKLSGFVLHVNGPNPEILNHLNPSGDDQKKLDILGWMDSLREAYLPILDAVKFLLYTRHGEMEGDSIDWGLGSRHELGNDCRSALACFYAQDLIPSWLYKGSPIGRGFREGTELYEESLVLEGSQGGIIGGVVWRNTFGKHDLYLILNMLPTQYSELFEYVTNSNIYLSAAQVATGMANTVGKKGE